MLSFTHIIGELAYVFLAFAGIDYASNEELKHSNQSNAQEQVALHVNIETQSSKFSTRISSSGFPTIAKSAPPKATKFKKWRLTITP